MDLLQLKYFKVVAEQEHITKSAKLLMVSQPYLSAIVARLEEEMGGQLFDRDGRNVVLNEYGKILLHHANEALQHLEDAKKEIADMRSRDTKYIRLGSSSTMLSKRWLWWIFLKNMTISGWRICWQRITRSWTDF